MTFILFTLFALIQWARGWSPVDRWRHNTAIIRQVAYRDVREEDAPKWAKVLHLLTQDWACGLYVIGLLLFFAPWELAVASGVLYFLAEYWFIKRVLFGTYDGKVSEYDLPQPFYKRPLWLLARPFRSLPNKLFATIYGTIAGLAWATMLLPFFSLSYAFIAGVALSCTFGVVYYAMNLLDNPSDGSGEAVGRTIYGGFLGLALAAVI